MTHLFWAVIMRACDTSCKLKQPRALHRIHLPRKQPAACMSYSYPLHLIQLIFYVENMTFSWHGNLSHFLLQNQFI